MRKILFCLAMLGLTVYAQAQKSQFGIKGGINAAKMSDASTEESGYRTLVSAHFGFLNHIHINKRFAVQPELLYSMQGTKYKVSNADYQYKLGYITIPVLIQLMTQNGWRFETGPQLGILLNAKNTRLNPQDVKGVFKSTDVAWAFGIGYITPSRFGFDVRYNLGLTDIVKDNDFNIKNNVLQAGMFYQFH